MEWVDVKPHDKGESMTIEEVVSICRRIGPDYEPHEDFVRVYGYRRMN